MSEYLQIYCTQLAKPSLTGPSGNCSVLKEQKIAYKNWYPSYSKPIKICSPVLLDSDGLGQCTNGTITYVAWYSMFKFCRSPKHVPLSHYTVVDFGIELKWYLGLKHEQKHPRKKDCPCQMIFRIFTHNLASF